MGVRALNRPGRHTEQHGADRIDDTWVDTASRSFERLDLAHRPDDTG